MDKYDAPRRPGLAVPIGLIAGAALVFMITLTVGYTLLVRPSMGGTGFESPGSITVVADEPSDFTLMHQISGSFEGRRHQADARDARGLRIIVTRAEDGSAVDFEPDDTFSMTVGSTHRATVGRFRAEQAGAYTVEASGNTSPVVLFVTRWSTSFPLSTVGAMFFLQILAVTLGWMGGSRLVRRWRAAAATRTIQSERSS